jgi:pimeloyl-ACP methyl ester carboxylesterase
MGVNDYQTAYPLAEKFFEEISSPQKIFFSIPNAGHNTMVDNKKEFSRILLEIIKPSIMTYFNETVKTGHNL